jgi:hypothetical protein
MPDTTTKLLLPYILAAQAQKHVTHNEALRLLDGLVQMSVSDRDLTVPPGSPAEGDRYIVASGATGDWMGWDDDIALFGDGIWFRLPKQVGWRAWVQDEGMLVVWNGVEWFELSGVVGSDGADGLSAYEVWLNDGGVGTEPVFLASLVGADGANGTDGATGTAGATGATGPEGVSGADGATGAQGPVGPDGADGTSVTILGSLASTGDLPGSGNTPGDGYVISGDLHVWNGAAWNNAGPIQGPASLIWQGAWATSTAYVVDDAVSNDGSAYICTADHTAGAASEPGIGGSWALLAAKGDTGAIGTSGADGSDGAIGEQGPVGADGIDGAPGADGVDGADGLSAQGTIGSGPVVLARRTVNAQAGSYTLVIGDEGAAIHMSSASAVTLAVPLSSAVAFPTGSEIEVVALDAGVVSLAGDTGVLINGISAGSADIAAQWQGAILRKYATDPWLLIGSIGDVT